MTAGRIVSIACTLLLAGAARAGPEDDLGKAWKGLDRAGKVGGLTRLAATPSRAVLQRCRAWIDDDDPLVRAQVCRLMAAHHADASLRAMVEKELAAYVRKQLAARAKREEREFRAVCKEHGTRLPPDGAIAAGADWQDPWDEHRRTLPPEVAAERAHMREVVAALETCAAPATDDALIAVLEEHHDPEVCVRAIHALGATGAWRGLAPMADLARIQRTGRAVGGGAVIGAQEWRDMRLKWDVHKDRLWWCRPEYMPRVVDPVFDALGKITGARPNSVRLMDRWLLDNADRCKAEGAPLARDFLARAEQTQ